jgi:hypothetical protein
MENFKIVKSPTALNQAGICFAAFGGSGYAKQQSGVR